ncbi:major facilitator superfamily domain-containing protein [Lasiosphaeria ovina]|uniref:Major facilitator superfamily domain-containing protein n=1 Tax=Lasiosphaeria ovina TaxID=92902 RepID=A0AAE0NFF5_9PEZI|nr:major facilitator superfamily domain-containing protein [Lasiosphaeria ovina]
MGSPDVEGPSVAVADVDRSRDMSSTGGFLNAVIAIRWDQLSGAIPPSNHYEGKHRWDPEATWTPQEEKALVRTRRASSSCRGSVSCSSGCSLLDRSNLSNAFADDLLVDLKLMGDDYNNGTTIQLLAFLAADWGMVSWAQAWMYNRTGFYITRALIGACEGGFIPGTILYATYFYTSKELSIRGIGGHTGWFWLFLLEGLLSVVIAIISFFYLPASPTNTTSAISRKPWYTERQEVIMVNRILRDDPAKGLTGILQPITVQDIKNTLMDRSLWGLYFIELVAYIPASPVQRYVTLRLRRIGFSSFDSNMLTIPSAVLQIITMLALAWSSDFFNERTLHCIFGELWIMPMLISLLVLPDGSREWPRFALITLTSGYPYFHPMVTSWMSENTFDVEKRAIAAAICNVIVQVGSLISNQLYRD